MNRAVGRTADRAAAARRAWLETIERHRHDRDAPGSTDYWSPRLDTASRDQLRAIQDDKIAAVAPFLYENSEFYRRRFDGLGLLPTDLRTVDDLIAKWPVVDKHEMAEDAAAHPPYGTYTAMTEEIWAERGWMMFSSSGTTGAPRVFRYSHIDRELWAWANARALQSMDFRQGDAVFMITGYGPHVWAWGVQYALAKMGLPTLPGGGMDARARANIVMRYKPTILLCTPSYALHLGRTVEALGADPRATSVRTLFVAGEPGINLRGIKMFPGQIEHAVRSIAGIGDEFEIVLTTNTDGLDLMTVRVEHQAGAEIGAAVADEIRSRCEVRAAVEVLAPGTLPRTEFKAARVKDRREKR